MAFGSLIPGMAPMQAQPMQNNSLNKQGMGILMAALQNRARPPAQPGVPGPMNISPQGIGGMGLLSRLFPQQQQAPGILPDAGGAGPTPNALTGMW